MTAGWDEMSDAARPILAPVSRTQAPERRLFFFFLVCALANKTQVTDLNGHRVH